MNYNIRLLAICNFVALCGSHLGHTSDFYEENVVFGSGSFPSDVPFVHMATQTFLSRQVRIDEWRSGSRYYSLWPHRNSLVTLQTSPRVVFAENNDVSAEPWVFDEEEISENQESDSSTSNSSSSACYHEASGSDTNDPTDTIMMDTPLDSGMQDDACKRSERKPISSSKPAEEKLIASKTSVFDPLVICALEGKGAKAPIMIAERSAYRISITNLNELLDCISQKSSKKNPTKNTGSRIKCLRNMFTDWPKGALQSNAFDVHVKTCEKTRNVGSARLSLLLSEYQSAKGE